MTKGERDLKYVLILKDGLSGYVWLLPYSEAYSSAASDGIVKWFSSFGVAHQWVSDQGTHFKNNVMRDVK